MVTLLILSDRTQTHTNKQRTNINPTKTWMKTQQQGAAFRLSKCVAAEAQALGVIIIIIIIIINVAAAAAAAVVE
jgi:hypothetical protein